MNELYLLITKEDGELRIEECIAARIIQQRIKQYLPPNVKTMLTELLQLNGVYRQTLLTRELIVFYDQRKARPNSNTVYSRERLLMTNLQHS